MPSMPSREPSTRSFATEKIADTAANLARVMGYRVEIGKKQGVWNVTAHWTPEVDVRFKERFG